MAKGFLEREYDVVGSGLAEGLSDLAATTLAGLHTGGQELAQSPLKTSLHYLSDHWKDALAGFAISAFNPRGRQALWLGLWSTRDLWEGLGKAVCAAANPEVDLTEARDAFKTTVSHEGVAFLTSLPMSICGSIGGRAMGNALFGKELGFSDFQSGRISSTDLKSNWYQIRDSLAPPRVKLWVFDQDGTTQQTTLYNVITMQEQFPKIASAMKLSTDEVFRLCGTKMDQKGSQEYPFFLEEALGKKFAGTPEEFEESIVRPYWQALAKNRQDLLKSFEDIPETMDALRAAGVRIASHTNAVVEISTLRYTLGGLDGRIERLFATESTSPELSDVVSARSLEHGNRLLAEFRNHPTKLQEITAVPRELQKPSPAVLQKLMQEYGLRPSQVRFIGDHPVSDFAAARDAGVPFWFARYGRSLSPIETETLLKFRAKPMHPDPPPQPGIRFADKPSDILSDISPKANYPAISRQVAQACLVWPRAASVLGYNLFPFNEIKWGYRYLSDGLKVLQAPKS